MMSGYSSVASNPYETPANDQVKIPLTFKKESSVVVIKSITNDHQNLNSTQTPNELERMLTTEMPNSPLKNMTLNLKEANKIPRKSIETTSTVNNFSAKDDDFSQPQQSPQETYTIVLNGLEKAEEI